jgi:hypothetical protein
VDKNLVGFLSGIGVPALILFAIVLVNYQIGGMTAVWKGYQGGIGMIGGFTLSICIALLIAGQMNVLVDIYAEQVNQFLRGAHGIWGAFGIGIVVPNMSGYSQVDQLWSESGLLLKFSLVGFFLSSRMLNLQSSLFFLPILGWKLSGIMYGVCFVVALVCTAAIQIISFMVSKVL